VDGQVYDLGPVRQAEAVARYAFLSGNPACPQNIRFHPQWANASMNLDGYASAGRQAGRQIHGKPAPTEVRRAPAPRDKAAPGEPRALDGETHAKARMMPVHGGNIVTDSRLSGGAGLASCAAHAALLDAFACDSPRRFDAPTGSKSAHLPSCQGGDGFRDCVVHFSGNVNMPFLWAAIGKDLDALAARI
jgi:hypothetical protein